MSARAPVAAGPGVLLVLDGWGHAPPAEDNALSSARTPVLDELLATCPSTLADASGEAVGLLPGTVGNSEIGHMVIGAGRPLPYDSLLVQRAIDAGTLRTDSRLGATLGRTAASSGALHLIGLCSDGQIHAHVEHLSELLAAAAAHRVDRVFLHAITDGRDVADGTSETYLARVAELAGQAGAGRIATVVGRGYAMDKAGDLELTEQAVALVADGRGTRAGSVREAVSASARGDEWVPPTVLAPAGDATVRDGDAVVWFNFRSDRIQQFADLLADRLTATGRRVDMLSLAQYDTRTAIPALVPRADASGGLADELAAAGLRSVRIAEAEKFEHVTYYVNGRDDTVRAVEEHVRVTGDGKPDYVARPGMNLDRVTRAVTDAVARADVDLVVANLANIDVVGHTGNLAATVTACEATDTAVRDILDAARAAGRWVLAVGDHGNAEKMTKRAPDGGTRPYGGHTTNPVPLVIVPAPGGGSAPVLPERATLADVAPTVLHLLGHEPGSVMTGRSLL
ncbi:2,3-bisphosphoglycerate-independent phosphoglycerate mutase [Streptomyces capillispiralis]|uniref:2,3-bisphosphoglycerate-independent phosphoglycerate mutase n=1 Tax=Streptomyces capillispiralis TaxID=68182 RepID=A0A561TAJ1_9ACTN|nr:2,3-bisphosphoglycerate-independent phosphoglycerate mutase [Streptomyces capillispiralis]TWF84144.1 phosphoglycerate mutase [Streptomyces capillispiralis]GHH92961.1 2,3-bisphosphoglycerate-independent phosphoglycerate mutase [Streptomyces capillispiralis]